MSTEKIIAFALTIGLLGFCVGYIPEISQGAVIERETIKQIAVAKRSMTMQGLQPIEAEEETETEAETEEETEAEPEFLSLGTFKATAYCPCEKCCGKWAHNRPTDENGNVIVYTASGEKAVEGVTIAADTRVLPFGTKVYINGNEYIVHDRGGAIKGNRIDVYYSDHTEASSFGLQEVELFVKNESQ